MPLGWVQVWEEVTGRSWGSPCCRSCSQREEGMFWRSPSLIASRLNKLLLLPTKFVKLLTACATKFFLHFLFVWLNIHNHDLRTKVDSRNWPTLLESRVWADHPVWTVEFRCVLVHKSTLGWNRWGEWTKQTWPHSWTIIFGKIHSLFVKRILSAWSLWQPPPTSFVALHTVREEENETR